MGCFFMQKGKKIETSERVRRVRDER